MNLERYQKALELGDTKALIPLTYEARRQGREDLLSFCYEVFLKETSGGEGEQFLSLVPCFMGLIEKPQEGSFYRPLASSKGLSSLIRYAKLSQDLDYQKASLKLLRNSSFFFLQKERHIYDGLLREISLTEDPLFLCPGKIPLEWSPEVLFTWLGPILEGLVQTFEARCPDCKDLKKAFSSFSQRNLGRSLEQAQKALSFVQKREKSVIRKRHERKPHPILLDKGPEYLGPSLISSRVYLNVLKTGPQRVLNSVRGSLDYLGYAYSEHEESHRLLAHLLGMAEAYEPPAPLPKPDIEASFQ